jgi:hypothetical protein
MVQLLSCIVVLLLATLGPVAPAAGFEERVEVDDCFAREPVQAYLDRLQRRILKYWRLPDEDFVPDQDVVLRLRVERGGMLVGYELVSWRDRRLAENATVALLLAFPFEAMSRDTACLAGQPILTTLRASP